MAEVVSSLRSSLKWSLENTHIHTCSHCLPGEGQGSRSMDHGPLPVTPIEKEAERRVCFSWSNSVLVQAFEAGKGKGQGDMSINARGQRNKYQLQDGSQDGRK